MVVKRPLAEGEEDDSEVLNPRSKQTTVSSNLARNVLLGLASQDLASTLEPLIREWVQDEVQRACQNFCCSSPRSPFNALVACGTTNLQLRFQTKLPRMLFTGSKVESKDNGAVRLVLFDADSDQIVSTGPSSSLKIQFVPLDGDFSVDDEDWPQKDFEAKVISARDGKRPLLGGDLVMVLKEGVGDLGDVFFTDNSSWRRSRTFRLGAHAVSGVTRIREAVSDPFMVKDHRGESYKKHHPPHLGDDIWRLEKIAKEGALHRRLGSNRIHTVKDLLQIYITNESSLRKILGGSCSKTWEAIIKHAKDCVLDDNLYIYNCMAEGIGILFNSIFTIVGATFDGQNYVSVEKLPAFQMHLVESLKEQFYKNLDGMLPMDNLSIFGGTILTSGLLCDPFTNVANIPFLRSDEPQMQLASAPHMFGLDTNSCQWNSSFICNDFSYGEGCSSGSGMVSGQMAPAFNYQENLDFSRNGSPRGRWCKIRAAVKWVSLMRDVIAKRSATYYPYFDFSA